MFFVTLKIATNAKDGWILWERLMELFVSLIIRLLAVFIGQRNLRQKAHCKDRPVQPPSVFPGIPASIVHASLPPQRTTKRTSCHEPDIKEDEFSAYTQLDDLTYSSLKQEFINEKRQVRVPFTPFVFN